MKCARPALLITLIGAVIGSAAAQTFQRAPDALERVTWRTRTLVGDDRLTRWKFAISAGALQDLTFMDAVVRANALGVNFIEGSNKHKVSTQMPKSLDFNLTADEVATVKSWLKDAGVRMLAYRVDWFGDSDARRKLFAFAKQMDVDTIVAPSMNEVTGLDALVDEFGVKVAMLGHAAIPVRLLKTLDGGGMRLGVAADTGLWAQERISPADALAPVKDRLAYVYLRDRSTAGSAGRNVMPGHGVGQLEQAFHELNRLNLRPLIITLDTAGIANTPADLFRAVEAFEEAVQPAYGAYFTELSRSRPIRQEIQPMKLAPDKVLSPEEVRQRIEAAIPREPYATPKKPRKLLVIDACLAGMSHNTIPHTNVMLELMGKITGAWTTELNNDLNNLKYPKIKEYDAVFLNDNVGELLPDPAVREGLARFVHEGGGLGGVHGTPWASRNWNEFAEMIGAQSAPHRIEQGIMKVHDSKSPIVKSFGGKELNFREEYYRFHTEGPGRLRWDKVRVLLTVDLDLEPSRPWNGYKRPDNVYPVTWIRSYGKGRSFYCSLGHMPETFMTPEIVGHFLAGVQFLLGDLEADTRPNGR